MTGKENGNEREATDQATENVVRFPLSRAAPVTEAFDPDLPAVYGAMAKTIGIPVEQTTGHWCSYCRQIWFGYLLEVTCPRCGGRHG